MNTSPMRAESRPVASSLNRLFLIAVLLSISLPVMAADWRNNRLIAPEKVTVGPSDNYQTQIDLQRQRIIYTQHQHLLSRIIVQDLATGIARSLLPPDHDAKDPALAPDGQRVAFTSFRNNALGGICIQAIDEAYAPACVTPPGIQAWNPFWVDKETIGYLRSRQLATEIELVTQPISRSPTSVESPTVIAKGQLSSPAMSADGRFLLYNRRESALQGSLHLYDFQTQEAYGPVRLSIPGITSFAVLDPREDAVYFSHYPSDTSGDGRIDGEDHSVIYRLPLSALRTSDGSKQPEPLTSVLHNCNFPALGGEHLYMTCAFEGSLDVYRLPREGQVPAHWTAAELWQAHASASHYEDRIFLLQTLRYRGLLNEVDDGLLERLVANHLGMNEFSAARFYIDELARRHAESGPASMADFYANLAEMIALEDLARRQPEGLRTARFRRNLEAVRSQLQPNPEHPDNQVFLAWLEYFSARPEQAERRLLDADPLPHPLGRYVSIQLGLWLYRNNPDALKRWLLATADDPIISADARLFHAAEYLKLLLRQRPSQADHIDELERAQAGLRDSRVVDLLAHEIDLLRLTAAEDRALERELYARIGERLRNYRDQLLMHRIAHIRAIQLTGLAERFTAMEWMSRHWLTHTPIRHVAFAPTAEQYAFINLNRAYGAWSQASYGTALNSFYSVTRQTNDLESLYQLLYLGLRPGAEPELTARMEELYQQLRAENLLGENEAFAEALRLLMETTATASLAQAIRLLEDFRPEGLDPGVADLLLGSLYHRQFLDHQDGYRFDRDLYQKAHHRYMMALDLAFRNPRVQAALLENLGALHFAVRNYGIAAEFWGQRRLLPVLTPEQNLDILWQQARALFYSNRSVEAFASAMEAVEMAQGQSAPREQSLALLERAAFYALEAGLYAEAADLYDTLLDQNGLSPNNRVRATFSHAYALFKLEATDAARVRLEEVMEWLPRAQLRPANAQRLAPFQPQRLQLQSYGLMAQMVTDPDQQLYWLTRRIALLEPATRRNAVPDHGLSEADRLEFLVLARLQAAALKETTGQNDAMSSMMRTALDDLMSYRRAGGSASSQAVLQALYNYLTLASEHPAYFRDEPGALVTLLQQAAEELILEDFTPPVSQGHAYKLQLLYGFYQARHQRRPTDQVRAELMTLAEEPAWQGLAQTRPDWFTELNELLAGVTRALAGTSLHSGLGHP